MKCEHCQEWLNQYIDYQLSAEESEWIEEHISLCKTCRKEYNELVYTKQASLSIPDFIPPSSFTMGWKAAVLAEMAPQAPQTQSAPKPKNIAKATAHTGRNGLRRTIRGIALTAAVLGVGIISVQAYNYFSAINKGGDLAKAPIANEQTEGERAESGAGLQEAAQAQQPGSGANINGDTASIADTQTPESTIFGDEQESDAESRDGGGSLLPQTTESLASPGAVAPSNEGEDDDAHSAVNGVKEVFLSVPVDKEMIEYSLGKENVVYKILEDAYIIEVDNGNIKAVNRVLNDLGSTETMLVGETLHIKLR